MVSDGPRAPSHGPEIEISRALGGIRTTPRACIWKKTIHRPYAQFDTGPLSYKPTPALSTVYGRIALPPAEIDGQVACLWDT